MIFVLFYLVGASAYAALQLYDLRRYGLSSDWGLIVGLVWLSTFWPVCMPIDALMSWNRGER